MTLAVSTVGFGRFTITHLTRMVSSTLRSGGNAHSGRIFSIGSLPCMALLPLLPFADLHLNSRKFSSDSFNASSKPGLATPGLHHPSNHLKKMAVSERSSKPGLATPVNATHCHSQLNSSLDVTTFISSQAHHGTTAFIDAATDP
ncbi:hypothetical protein Bca52824_076506 [Brassica carinata]|uniref:Uncharacterized protein n=1 Tax=Brassica carinata TaxID=52824 RepID=A0A8X7PU48_BRACI|nr:hypothetical protein Bca52824_076506 [Brassica carinata]